MLKKLLCAVFMLAAGSAQASMLQYSYTGHELFPEDDIFDGRFDYWFDPPKSMPAMHLTLTIDEKHVPGGDLAGKTLSYYGDGDDLGGADPPLPLYLAEIGGFGLFPDRDGSGFYFEFDHNKALKSWNVWMFSRDSYYIVDSSGDYIEWSILDYGPFGAIYRAAPWSGPTPIPLPATAWLMLGLVGGLGVKAWRARNQPAT